MKKFIIKLVAFIVAITVIILIVNSVYIKLDKSNPDYINKFEDIPDKIQICNFGSSHGLYGYNYEDIEDKYKCFNFGLVSQTLSYDYRLFQYYGDHIEEGSVVFITISYFSLFGKDEVNEDDFESKNKRYYTILPPSLIKEYNFKTDLLVRRLPSLGVDTIVLIKTLLGDSTGRNFEEWQQTAMDIDVDKDAQAAYVRHIEKNKYNEGGHRIVNQEEIDALYALIEACKEKGAIPVLITTPYLSEYVEEIKENAPHFYDDFYAIVNRIVKDTGVDYYDYAFDERFTDAYAWFMNSDHLNRDGARKFVNILMQEIIYEKGLDKLI